MAVEKRLSNPMAMTTAEISGNDRKKALALLAKFKEMEKAKEEKAEKAKKAKESGEAETK